MPFALGWATALYFGQVPGRQGRILSLVSLLAAGWVVLIVGFAPVLAGGAALDAFGMIEDNFSVVWYHYVGLVAALILIPPFIAAATVYGDMHEERNFAQVLRLLPVSYPAAVMLGVSVLQMVAITPALLFGRWRAGRKLLQVPLIMKPGTDDDDPVEAVRTAASSVGIEGLELSEASGPVSWPMRTVGYVARHLLGAAVRGEPMRLATGDLKIYVYATTVAINAPKELAYRVRAVTKRDLPFGGAYLTWSEEAQGFEDEMFAAREAPYDDVDELLARLDIIEERMDAAPLDAHEWDVLYRLRLQMERPDGAARSLRDEDCEA